MQDYFRLSQWGLPRKKLGAINKEENGKVKTKRVLDDFKMPKLEQIFTTIAMMCHRFERLAVLEIFSDYCPLMSK